MIAPQTLRSDEVTLIWNKPVGADPATRYHVLLDGQQIATTAQTFHTLRDLSPAHAYTLTVEMAPKSPVHTSLTAKPISFSTPAVETWLSVLDYGAVGDGTTLNTRALQAAIDACPPHGVVSLPAGTFLTGALYLKSDMTLHLAAGAVLQGTANPADYRPFNRNRFEGWEMDTYASLINGGRLDRDGPPNLRHVSIRGEGTIAGGGRALYDAIVSQYPNKRDGYRARGRLILLMNAADIEIAGVTLDEPSCWTLHYIYSQKVSLHGLTIRSDVHNGDGIDPDSSLNSYIFNTTFDTGDDCIAIKSGKNPEGNVVARPTENVWIAHCRFDRGHGISIGSEMSGGVRNVLVRDCSAGPLLHGMQIKGTRDRGGFVEQVVVRDCDLQQVTIFTQLPYNNDGEPAPAPPIFRDFQFLHLDLTGGSTDQPLIIVNGYPEADHQTRDITFDHIRLPAGAAVTVDQSRAITFTHVTTTDGSPPVYTVTRSTSISH